jgi:hypothetical protein
MLAIAFGGRICGSAAGPEHRVMKHGHSVTRRQDGSFARADNWRRGREAKRIEEMDGRVTIVTASSTAAPPA